MHDGWTWVVKTDWGFVMNATLGATFFLLLGYLIFIRMPWDAWQKRKKDKDLRRRFSVVLGFDLARAQDAGYVHCVRRVHDVLSGAHERLRLAKDRARHLRTTYPHAREGLIWAEVQDAERQVEALENYILAVEHLAKEAEIPFTECALPSIRESMGRE